jgi:sulfur carrier protein ThiS adenylyltransferase
MTNRYVRQADLVPRERLHDLTATVVGVGAIGRQVALQLASMGLPRIQLIDFDTVDETNITTQGYGQHDLLQPKVEACRLTMANIDPDINVVTIPDRYRPTHVAGEAVFCCVDSITARGAIWRGAGSASRFWCDGRMLGEVIRIVTVDGPPARDQYPGSLFAATEADPGRCTARSTIYTANIAAGLMLHQFTRWLRGLPTDFDLSLNLLASELVVC